MLWIIRVSICQMPGNRQFGRRKRLRSGSQARLSDTRRSTMPPNVKHPSRSTHAIAPRNPQPPSGTTCPAREAQPRSPWQKTGGARSLPYATSRNFESPQRRSCSSDCTNLREVGTPDSVSKCGSLVDRMDDNAAGAATSSGSRARPSARSGHDSDFGLSRRFRLQFGFLAVPRPFAWSRLRNRRDARPAARIS